MVLPLVVIDVHEDVAKDPDYTLSLDRVKKWEKEHGQIPNGAFVAMRTDWSKRWPDAAKMENKDANGVSDYDKILTKYIPATYIASITKQNEATAFLNEAIAYVKVNGEKKALRVLRVSHAIVEQIPVQAVDASVMGMTRGAALPALEAERRVVEPHFSLPALGSGHWTVQGDFTPARCVRMRSRSTSENAPVL